jgi:hypothetical protein
MKTTETIIKELREQLANAQAVTDEFEAWLRTQPKLRGDIIFLRRKRAGGAIHYPK